MTSQTNAVLAQLFTAVAALLVAAVFIYFKPINEIQEATWVFLSLFASMVLIDRIGRLVVELAAKNTKDETLEKLAEIKDEIPSIIAGNNNVVVFSNRKAALEYCIAMLPRASSVKNTVLRYGDTASAPPNDADYRNWRDAKERSVTISKVPWQEIVSCRLKPTDDAMKFSKEMHLLGDRAYELRLLDDSKCAMIQMTFFEFKDGGKEVLFGWGIPPDSQHGLAILTRNAAVVDYFYKYWIYCWREIATRVPQVGD